MPLDVAAAVIGNRTLSADYNVLALAAPGIASIAAPGQFVMLKAAAGHDPLLRRPFSVFEILREPDGRVSGLTILNKRIGPSTRLLYAAREGDRIACLGPLGNAWPIVDTPARAFLVAGGVGLAAFATVAEALAARGTATTLFYGARTGGELFYLDVFERLGVELVLTTEDGSTGERGRVVAPLERRLAAEAGRPATVYACGPDPMMAAVARVAAAAGVPCYVSLERIMGCGMGGCYSCVVPVATGAGTYHHVRSCVSGPIMAADRLRWD
jgi:dihydroorotate dehydrogenase electron transfer subunit